MSTAKRKHDAVKADEMIRQFAEQSAAPDDSATPPAGEGLSQDAGAGGDATPSGEDQGQGQAGDAVAVSGQDAPTEVPREETADYWRHKYKSLDGIIRRKDSEIEQMRDMLAAMQQSISNMEQRHTEQKEQQASQPLVSKEDEDTFGSDLVDFVRRVTQDTLRSVKQELRQEFEGLQSQVKDVSHSVQMTAKEKFERTLDDHDPSWRQLDADPAFIQWLQASPTRVREWAAAVRELDAEAVMEKFDTYKILTQQRQAQEQRPRDEKRRQLEKQVAPGKSRAVASEHTGSDEKKTWTSSEISRAFSQRKQYQPQEWAKIERDIFAAQAEGRVDYSR